MSAPVHTETPRDWRRIPRYLASDIPWIRGRIERGDLDGALLAISTVRLYLLADTIALIPSTRGQG